MANRSLGIQYFDNTMLTKLLADPSLIDKRLSSDEGDEHRQNMNLLHLACQEGLYLTAKLILSRKKDLVNETTAVGWTPVMMACE